MIFLSRLKPLLQVVAACGFAACTSHVGRPGDAQNLQTAAYRVGVQRNLVYSPADWPQKLYADIYIPRGLGPYPAVLVIHGGDWDESSRSSMDGVAESLARKGYVAVNITHRTAPQHRFPAQVHDVQQALRWLRGKGDAYKIDPQRVAVFGYSSGGHLAALIGTIGDTDPLDQPHGGPDTRVQAVVAGGAPSDLRDDSSGKVAQLMGGGPGEQPAAYALASPITHVSAGDAPFFLYHGSFDTEVPIAQAENMKAALDAAGVPAELYRIRGLGHVASFVFDADAEEEAVNFLDRHLRKE